jgi:hypothetical protein
MLHNRSKLRSTSEVLRHLRQGQVVLAMLIRKIGFPTGFAKSCEVGLLFGFNTMKTIGVSGRME